MLYFIDFLRFIKYSFCFTEIDSNLDGLIHSFNIRDSYSKCFPMKFYPSELYDLQWIVQFLGMDRMANLKHFFTAFNFRKVFLPFVTIADPFQVEKEEVVRGLRILGFLTNLEIIEEAKDSTGSTYNYEFAVRESIKFESACAENFSLANLFFKNQLKNIFPDGIPSSQTNGGKGKTTDDDPEMKKKKKDDPNSKDGSGDSNSKEGGDSKGEGSDGKGVKFGGVQINTKKAV